jgi:transposase
MLRSQTVNTIHDLHLQEKSVQEIATDLKISRTTVRKYLKHPEAVIRQPRPPRPSKLDPFKDQIKQWVTEDHCTNCEVMLTRLREMGYTGGISILKEFVHPLRPAVAGQAPVQRYETKPGEQVQFDWGEFVYEQEGTVHKFYGFVAILCYSRMRFVTEVSRCDTPTLIRCLMEAFEYFGGVTKVALTDRMKSVLLSMEENTPRWNPRFADFMVSIGVAARVCKAYTPQTKGKVERSVSHVKTSFWAGVTFTDLDDLNRQAHGWCQRINSRVHRTTHMRPVERLEEEKLAPLPPAFAWERFATEERHP